MFIRKPQAWRLALGAAAVAVIGVAAVAYAQPARPINTLTQAERAAGWKLLFNGKDLNQWRVYRKPDVAPQWTIEDGAITLTAGGAGDLMTREEYGDFELSLDWKISPGGNSGVIYRIKEADSNGQTYYTGPEMQVLDDDGHADGKIPSHRAGAIYDLVVPKAGVVRPVGQWNTARVVLRKGHLEHWLNGVKVAESSYGDEAWKKMVAGSKFKAWPQFGLSSNGHIALQDHGNRVWYRNIKLRQF
jgi:hypothetical protein